MTTSPVMSITDELVAELEFDLEVAETTHQLEASVSRDALAALLAERAELLRDAERMSELAAQANVNCKNTAYYLRKYRPDLADICSGWCTAIDSAMQSEANP